MRVRRLIGALVAAAVLCLPLAILAEGAKEEAQPAAATPRTLAFYSGSPGGGWYPIAVAIGEMWAKNIPGLSFTHADAGGAGNIVALDEGKAQLAISTSASIGDGAVGNPPFKQKTVNVKGIAAFNSDLYTIFSWKDSDIEEIAQLKGKRLVPLPKGYTAEVLTQAVLKALGLTYNDLAKVDFVSLTQAVGLMQDGHIDAMANAFAPTGDPNITELALQRPIRALEIPEAVRQSVQAASPGIYPAILEKGSYNGIDRDVPVLGFSLALAVRADLPEDLVYRMTKLLVENWSDIQLVSRRFEEISPEELARPNVGVGFHPGAARYYREQGWLK